MHSNDALNQTDSEALLGPIEDAVTKCIPMSPEQKEEIEKEVMAYEKNGRYRRKMDEVRGKEPLASWHVGILKYLRSKKVLQPGWSVLELGCAAGIMLKSVKELYEEKGGIGNHGAFVGVELVPGWVSFAQEYFKDRGIDVYNGDVSEFSLPKPYHEKTFDFIMLNDVAEHILVDRYGCLFQKLKEVTHKGSIIYMHTPTPRFQVVQKQKDQYINNIFPNHFLVMGMRMAGFELVTFEHDLETNCGNTETDSESVPRLLRDSACTRYNWPLFYHSIFIRVGNLSLFELSAQIE